MTDEDEGEDRRLGQVVGGRYRLDALLGAGGMGRVYRAEHLALGEPVAVKFLLAEHAAGQEVRARFRREAVLLARLRHPNVVSVIDHGEHAGELYLVMELLRGRSLDREAEREGGLLALPRVVAILDQVLQVLEVAHEAGVVHRDLKPENVMLLDTHDRADRVKVIDFGIAQVDEGPAAARLTATGTIRGTPMYMSPEQGMGRGVGAPTDIYAVGAMLYELLVGEHAFQGGSTLEILSQHLFAAAPTFAEKPPPREVPLGFEALVQRCLAKKPEQRPTATELRQALARCLQGTDTSSLAAREAAQRLGDAALSREARALAPKAARVEPDAAEGAPFSASVALVGFSPERAATLRAALSARGLRVYALASPAPESPEGRPWGAVLLPGEGAALRVQALRAAAATRARPILVLDVTQASEAPTLIRAGASDWALASVDDVAVAQKVLRAVRRGR